MPIRTHRPLVYPAAARRCCSWAPAVSLPSKRVLEATLKGYAAAPSVSASAASPLGRRLTPLRLRLQLRMLMPSTVWQYAMLIPRRQSCGTACTAGRCLAGWQRSTHQLPFRSPPQPLQWTLLRYSVWRRGQTCSVSAPLSSPSSRGPAQHPLRASSPQPLGPRHPCAHPVPSASSLSILDHSPPASIPCAHASPSRGPSGSPNRSPAAPALLSPFHSPCATSFISSS